MFKEYWQKIKSNWFGPLTIKKMGSDPNASVRLGMFISLFGFGGFVLWAAMAPMDMAIVAQGVVNVESSKKTVQHLRGGIVKEILVHGGDLVKKGDPLIRLEDAQIRATLTQLKTQLFSMQATRERLLAERAHLNVLVFSESLRKEAVTPATIEFMNSQEELFLARRNSMKGDVAILKENIAGLEERLNGVQNMSQGRVRQIELLEDQLKAMRALLQKGYVARNQLFDLERTLATVTGARAEDMGNMANMKKSIAELKLRILRVDAEFQKEIAMRLEDVDRSIGPLREQIASAQDDMDRVVITAPVDGVVMGIKPKTIGGVISSGQELMSVVPVGEKFAIDIQVKPEDIDRVHVGLLADVRLSAFNRNTTPILKGKVTMVSPDRTLDDRTAQPSYPARIMLTEESMKKLGDLQIQAGMPADVIIKLGERSLLAYLVKPAGDRLALSGHQE